MTQISFKSTWPPIESTQALSFRNISFYLFLRHQLGNIGSGWMPISLLSVNLEKLPFYIFYAPCRVDLDTPSNQLDCMPAKKSMCQFFVLSFVVPIESTQAQVELIWICAIWIFVCQVLNFQEMEGFYDFFFQHATHPYIPWIFMHKEDSKNTLIWFKLFINFHSLET